MSKHEEGIMEPLDLFICRDWSRSIKIHRNQVDCFFLLLIRYRSPSANYSKLSELCIWSLQLCYYEGIKHCKWIMSLLSIFFRTNPTSELLFGCFRQPMKTLLLLHWRHCFICVTIQKENRVLYWLWLLWIACQKKNVSKAIHAYASCDNPKLANIAKCLENSCTRVNKQWTGWYE